MKPLIQVQDLSVTFPLKSGLLQSVRGYFTAVQKVNFCIDRGQCLGVVGESGSGKSTLGLACLGLQKISSGQIHIRDEIADSRWWIQNRRRFQMVFQDSQSSLNPRRTIAQILADPLRHYQVVPKAQILERSVQLLKQVGLDADMLERYPHAFSGGQRQRINIARALSTEPEFLVCDEVSSALDVRTQAQILDLLQSLQQNLNLAMLFISHDLAVVKGLAQEVLVMEKSHVVEQGLVKDVFEMPQQNYTKALLASIPRI